MSRDSLQPRLSLFLFCFLAIKARGTLPDLHILQYLLTLIVWGNAGEGEQPKEGPQFVDNLQQRKFLTLVCCCIKESYVTDVYNNVPCSRFRNLQPDVRGYQAELRRCLIASDGLLGPR